MAAANERPDQRIDEIMAVLLRSGVLLSAGLVFLGGMIFLVRHPMPVLNYRNFQGEPPEYTTISGILRDAAKLHGRGLIQLGMLLLIATPVARVLFSVFAFLYERDWTYVSVTLIVLGLLTYSLFGGGF
jgi:uncharacterized membrane protein